MVGSVLDPGNPRYSASGRGLSTPRTPDLFEGADHLIPEKPCGEPFLEVLPET